MNARIDGLEENLVMLDFIAPLTDNNRGVSREFS